eukprot:5709663-Prymnesium_polylepis.1
MQPPQYSQSTELSSYCCEELHRTMRAPAVHVSLEQKLMLAHAMVAAGDTLTFPEPDYFLFDW